MNWEEWGGGEVKTRRERSGGFGGGSSGSRCRFVAVRCGRACGLWERRGS